MSVKFLSLIIAVLIVNGATPRSAEQPGSWTVPFDATRLTGAPHEDSRVLLVSGRNLQADKLGGAPLAAVTRQGLVSWVDPRFGRYYLALPYPRGTRARICGIGGCITRTSTDYGPSQRIHPDRIADLSAVDFEYVCAVPRRFGLCNATLTILKRGSGPSPRAIPTAPATDLR